MSTRFGASKKTRHVELRFLLMQELVQQGILQVKNVAGTSNPRHGFCLGLLRAVFWQLRWYSFSAWLVCELHTGLCPLRLGRGFLLHAGLCPLLLGHGFSADFLLDSNFGDLSLFRNFVFEMAPKAALLGLHSSALPAPSTPEEAEVTRDFTASVLRAEHQLRT